LQAKEAIFWALAGRFAQNGYNKAELAELVTD
jgi:hypothetical protein